MRKLPPMLEATVIGAFYNRIEYLKLVLAGFERQTIKNFEFIIADDGSDEAVVNEIKKKYFQIFISDKAYLAGR
ncbi:MAG: glycosyltransferase [Ignavibacteriaceae bacterium]|nr:glycosyltransferase [Ignavibacteriaceae bacterium]